MTIKKKSLLFLMLISSLFVVGCSCPRPVGDRVEIIAFVDSQTNIREILRTSKEINDYDVGIRFNIVDIFVEPKLAASYRIKSTPDFIILVDGTFLTKVDNLNGACAVAVSESVRIMRENNRNMPY